MDNDIACVYGVRKHFLGWLGFNTQEGKTLLWQADDDHVNNVMPVFKVLLISAPVELQFTSLRVVNVSDEVVDQVIDVQTVVFLAASKILVLFLQKIINRLHLVARC